MNELLFLTIINFFVIVASFVLQYISLVNNRKGYDEQIAKLNPDKTKKNSLQIFLPGKVGAFIASKLPKSEKKNDVNAPFIKQINPINLAAINIALIVLSFNLQTLFKIQWYVSVLVLAVAQVVFYLYLQGKKVQSREALEKKLPEILDMMARVYRVHSDLRVAVKEVADNATDDAVKTLFTHAAQLSRFGYSVEESLEYVAKEVQSSDFDFVVSSIKLNAPVGGNLHYLFEHTANMLRQRKDAADEISNLMFQSKISATISALLVPVIIVFSFVSSPKYQDALLRNPTGRMIFFFSLIWWFIGVVIIRKNSRVAL